MSEELPAAAGPPDDFEAECERLLAAFLEEGDLGARAELRRLLSTRLGGREEAAPAEPAPGGRATPAPYRERLLQAWQERGDLLALNELLAELLEPLRNRLKRISSQAGDPGFTASDFAQSAARRLIDRGADQRFHSVADLLSFLMTIARNRIRDVRRGNARREADAPPPAGEVGDDVSQVAREDALGRALPLLQEEERRVIELFDVQGRRMVDVARELGLERRAAYELRIRALRRLRDILGPSWGGS